MKLPIPFLATKKDDHEYYLALLLTDEKASAVILQEIEGKIKILSTHEEFFSSPIEEASLEELIDAVDKTISRAEEILPPKVETHKTVFGVKESWVEQETKKIKKEHLAKLKKVCDALDLSPIGFMVTTEAISHLMQEEDGAPFSAILAEVGRKLVTVTLIRGGRILEAFQGQITHSPAETVDTLLKHFTIEVLPARIVIVHSDTSEHLSQQFVSHQWSKSLPFLHVPQVTILQKGFDARAVTFGAAAQMGFEVLGVGTHAAKPIEPPDEIDEEKPLSHTEEPDAPEEKPFVPDPLEEEAPAAALMSGDNFGFVTGEDIATQKPHHTEPHHEKHPIEKTHHEKPHEHPHHPAHHTEKHIPEVPAHVTMHHKREVPDFEEDLPIPREHEASHKPKMGMPKIALPSLKGVKLPEFGNKKKLIIPLAIFGALLLGAGGLYFYYLSHVKANVLLTVKPKMVNETATVTFSTDSSSDFSKNILAVKSIVVSVDGQASTDATGKKDVGEKAKGTVTVYNNDNEKTTLSSGTEIKSNNGVIFTLDKDISIASQSGDVFSGTKPGTTTVGVTAKDIGPDSNLPSGTKFAIGGDTTLAAKNDNAFSGGSKKSVTVISKEDIAKLKTTLPKSLESKAKETISQETEGDETVLPVLTGSTLSKSTFDKAIGDEAKKVTLKATVSFTGMAYKNADLTNFAEATLKNKYSDNISFADNSIKAAVQGTKAKDEDAVEGTLDIQGGLLPNINSDDVVKDLDGKSLKDAELLLSDLPQVADSNITFSPNIPLLPLIMPQLPKTISVEIQSAE